MTKTEINFLVQGFFTCIRNPVLENDSVPTSGHVFLHLKKLKESQVQQEK